MNQDEIERVSRSFTGHIVTNPHVRTALNAATQAGADAHARIADVINSAVAPATPVSAADVPAIARAVNAWMGADEQPRAFEKIHPNTRMGISLDD